MKIYKTQKEVDRDIKDGNLIINGDVKFECSISIEASIDAGNINAGNINAGNINAGNIDAWNIDAEDINAGNIDAWNIDAEDINAGNINAGNIDAEDINAWNIDAGNINARNINAGNIDARNIDAEDISYCAFCCVYNSIKCVSIKAKREKHQEPICLEGKLTYKNKEEVKEVTMQDVCNKFGYNVKIKK